MSFQLIFTSAAHLLDSGASGYGVVARSHSLPQMLYARLMELNTFKEPAEIGIIGPQYSYRTLDCGGSVYHVLSCIQDAGADYSRRRCHIAHHLVLTFEEVQAMRRNSIRPTPAGIAYALHKVGFWISKWVGEPRYIENEPRLTASALPDASLQVTWKAMTGHKGNARAFLPPFDKECLTVFPKGTTAEDILLIFNESDWLSATRGWGRTFTTYGTPEDSFTDIQRISVPVGNDLELRTSFRSRPCLRISSSLCLPNSPVVGREAESDPLGRGFSRGSVPTDTTTEEAEPLAIHLPYKYIESPDEETFDTPPPIHPYIRLAGYVAGLLLLAVGIYALTSTTADDAGEVAGTLISKQIQHEDSATLLHSLLAAPYSPEKTCRVLDKVEARLREHHPNGEGDQSVLLSECIGILRHASIDIQGHAANLQRLSECAAQLGLNADNLCCLYMHEATHDRTIEEWLSGISLEERQAWERLLDENPHRAAWLMQPPFLPFMEPLYFSSYKEDKVVLSETNDSAQVLPESTSERFEPAKEQEHEGDVKDAISPVEHIFVLEKPTVQETENDRVIAPGEKIPESMERLLSLTQSDPLNINHGEYVVTILGVDSPLPVELRSNDSVLRIKRSENTYLFEVSGAEESGHTIPSVVVTIKKKQLKDVTTIDGRPAALRLTLSTGDTERPVTYIMAGHYAVPIEITSEEPPPPIKQAHLPLTLTDLELKPMGPSSRRVLLKPREELEYPWKALRHECSTKEVLYLNLPRWTQAGNEITEKKGKNIPYTWECISPVDMREADADYCQIRVWRVYDFSKRLKRAFYEEANTPRDSKRLHPFFSLSTLYQTLLRLEKPNLTDKARNHIMQGYFKLMADTGFNTLVADILSPTTLCCIPQRRLLVHKLTRFVRVPR